MRTINKKFESLSALSSFIFSTPANGVFAGNRLASELTDQPKFYGSKSFEAANDLMLQGWSEGAKRVKNYMDNAKINTAQKRVIFNSVVGFAPNVPNYLAGNPLNMVNQRRVKTPKKVVSIVYNCTVGYNIKSFDIEKTAAALFNVVSGLEASGVRVELWIADFSRSKCKTENLNIAVKIKSAGQPFNLLKMIYPSVHPSFSRRHCFAVIERSGLTGDWLGSYGACVIDKDKSIKACQDLRIPSDNVFSFYDLRDKTESEIAKMIR